MTSAYQIRVYENQQLVHTGEFAGPLELGRQSRGDERLYAHWRVPGRQRIVIARVNEPGISRKHVLLEPLSNGQVQLTNVSDNLPIHLGDGVELMPHSAPHVLSLPAQLHLGAKTVHVEPAEADESPLESLAMATQAPGQRVENTTRLPQLPVAAGIEMEAILSWLQVVMDVFQSAATSSDFFEKAGRAAVDLIGLNTSQVLLLHGDEWQPAAAHGPSQQARTGGRPPSQRVLHMVRQEKRTFWQVQTLATRAGDSLQGIQAVVAAPILDRNKRVIGALYGDRQSGDGKWILTPITRLEAMLVELLASGVAAGLTRLEQEQAALAARVQFEQFFTPELARQLAVQPDLLKGRDAEVTILFSDLRGFSRISERLGPARTVEWMGDVIEVLSDCVLAEQGVLVDYIGDELMAMWGVPEVHADHAVRACRAALAMQEQLPRLNERWQEVLGEPMGLGIGIHTGVARVGNVGSQRKFKYGPLGNTVNLASRVQGATRHLKCNFLATRSARMRLGPEFCTRRLCSVRVVNIAEPVELHEIVAAGDPEWNDFRETYEKALAEFEGGQFREAARLLAGLVAEPVNDGPALVLMARAVNALVDGPAATHPVWELPGK